ncbi:MAG: response regulator [Verrucomicrobia bacterium]|nr:response regulator [Verrucomicrobiota bacterium]MCH8527514.1 response regulator [Kiritimatiellia bacterium]
MPSSATILVVDDDPSIRRLARRMLSSLGFETHEAATGQEALKHIETKSIPLTAMLTDMNLPDMQGDALCDWARNLRPGLPVIFFSGAPLRESARLHLNTPNTFHLPKPFTKEAIGSLFDKFTPPCHPSAS